MLAVPLVFAALPTRALAGEVACGLFTAVNYLGAVCGVLLLFMARAMSGRWLVHTRACLMAVMLLTLLNLAVFDPWLDRLRVTAERGLWLVLLDGGGATPATE